MAEERCPVDHTKRGEWMQKMSGSPPVDDQPKCPVDHSARSQWLGSVSVTAKTSSEAVEVAQGAETSIGAVSNTQDTGCDSSKISDASQIASDLSLPTEREISSIPRTDAPSNWIYPSQKQFYDAMKRKKWNPEAQDMLTVVPIHNHVNELAWKNILNWERTHVEESNQKCGGISLTSFKGDLKKLTPRAWFKWAVLGLDKPFDRHDWVISRCGLEVPYVIDFYSAGASGVIVDVRPKLNSWEGLKLRVGRALGWA